MTTLPEVMSDLRAEVATLDALLEDLDDEAWATPTPAEGWDIRDTVAHLADTDDLMFESITGGTRDIIEDAQAAGGTVDAFTAWQVEKGRKLLPRQVFDWWRSATARLHSQIDACDPAQKYPWGGNMLSPLSLASARIMETWAHSLDCHAALGKPLADTDRLRHIAHLGLRALPYAFSLAGLEAPGSIRLELTSPAGDAWTFGPADAPTVIRGRASDWCRVAAHRARGDERLRLQGNGPDATNALANARAFL